MTRRARPAPKRAKSKSAKNRLAILPGASPITGIVPPPEHRFQAGNTASKGHGRPRKLADLKELILETLAEEVPLRDDEGRVIDRITRAQAAIRTMLVKSPSDRIALLEYAFGKVPNTMHVIDGRRRVIELLRAGQITAQDVIDELGADLATELFESAGISVAEAAEVGAESAGAAGDGNGEAGTSPDSA